MGEITTMHYSGRLCCHCGDRLIAWRNGYACGNCGRHYREEACSECGGSGYIPLGGPNEYEFCGCYGESRLVEVPSVGEMDALE